MVNTSKYRKTSEFYIGDKVFVRNHNKTSKNNQIFFTEPFEIIGWKNHQGK